MKSLLGVIVLIAYGVSTMGMLLGIIFIIQEYNLPGLVAVIAFLGVILPFNILFFGWLKEKVE
jgi:hypothetical protein